MEREDIEDGERSFLKLLYIFGGPDSNEKLQKLAKSTKSDEDLEEVDSYRSGFKHSGPHD